MFICILDSCRQISFNITYLSSINMDDFSKNNLKYECWLLYTMPWFAGWTHTVYIDALESDVFPATFSQLPSYRNSLGMRHDLSFVLLFKEVFQLEGEERKWKGKERKREKKRTFSLTSGHFPNV